MKEIFMHDQPKRALAAATAEKEKDNNSGSVKNILKKKEKLDSVSTPGKIKVLANNVNQ